MAKPKALSLGQIARAARTSAQQAGADHNALPLDAIHTVRYFPPRHWLGFVIDQPKIDEFTLGHAARLAEAVHVGIGNQVVGAKGGTVGVSLDGDLLILGFAPPPDVNVLEP
jgi:hypothetical protein